MYRSRALIALTLTAAAAGCSGKSGTSAAGPAPAAVDVGYGTQEAGKVTGSVSSVAGNKSLRVDELLRGVSGLQVTTRSDGTYSLRIRGGSAGDADPTLEPLVVVDGVPIANGGVNEALAGLTREDIRQVDVLKDIASTAIYGQRGAAGVILITTNRRK